MHTFLTGAIRRYAHHNRLLHLLSEVELVFIIWAIPLLLLMLIAFGPAHLVTYLTEQVSFKEAIFVFIVMIVFSSKPVLVACEKLLETAADLMGGTTMAWWLAILTLTPILGSLITEPAAMTIAALMLGKNFYRQGCSKRLAYATLGLLFVNVSVGGTLTNFAAPPVIMVALPWQWSTGYMFSHFGWKACLGIVLSNAIYLMVFRKEFSSLPKPIKEKLEIDSKSSLRNAALVALFLAGLVIHGNLQGWWIKPILESAGSWSIFFISTFLTSFNDNAAITFLGTLAALSEPMKYALVSGAVVGGGLTVIANAPNPAGQAILARYFNNQLISPFGLLLGALIPTTIMGICFMLL